MSFANGLLALLVCIRGYSFGRGFGVVDRAIYTHEHRRSFCMGAPHPSPHFRTDALLSSQSVSNIFVKSSMPLLILSVFYPGFMTNVYQKGDQLIVIHSHQVQPPVMPRKYRVIPTGIPLGEGEGD